MKPCPTAHVRRRARRATTALSIAALTLVGPAAAAAKPRDWDNDGLRNRAEFARHTNPWKKDTDGDGLRDGREVKKWHTNPRRKDTDRDGLRDGREVKKWHTNPRKRDTDGDGLSDRYEIRKSKTNPRRKDTDRDGLRDGREVKKWHTNPRKRDTDGDGLSDRYEIRKSKTNPRRKDTDRDGVPDGVEVLAGTNPRSRKSKPALPAPATPPKLPGPTLPGLPPLPACTTTAASVAAAQSAVSAGAAGTVVCLADGTHGSVNLSGAKPGTVTLRPLDVGAATIGRVSISGSNLRLAGFVVNGQVTVAEGASNITIDRNAINSGSFGVLVDGRDDGPVSNVFIGANRISGAGASSGGENDLLRLHYFAGVRIEGNELRDIEETGGHSDILQSVHGGRGLIFKRNFVHEQGGTQGFFLKDGAVTNVTVEDNLIVDDPSANGYAVSIYDTSANPGDPFYTGYGAVIRRNTVWDDKSGIAVRSGNTTILFEQNVTTAFVKESGTVTGAGNVIGRNQVLGAGYLLPGGAAGVTWSYAAQVYGPQG